MFFLVLATLSPISTSVLRGKARRRCIGDPHLYNAMAFGCIAPPRRLTVFLVWLQRALSDGCQVHDIGARPWSGSRGVPRARGAQGLVAPASSGAW